jgi:eukaryotic-like serine/threonine-protein kinase
LRAPRVIGRYLVCESIASGGMATVHLGRLMGPEGFSRTVAIKQLHPQYARDPEFISMFLDEARLAGRVRHPNVVSPLDVVVDPPELFIVMDYVHGEPLSRLMRRASGRPAPAAVAAAIVGQVLLGLHAAHEAVGESGEPLGIVHRDVSPQNILVSVEGVARVVDFGIAKATNRAHRSESGKLKGKLGYMAPEQVRFEHIDRRTDVFAAGVVLWEMLTGQRLFEAENPAAAVDKVMHGPIARPSELLPGLDGRLDELVLCALSRDPAGRFENARAMAVALESVVPPSSMLAVAEWLDSLAGGELRRRADHIADIEGASFEELTQALPRQALLGLARAEPRAASAPEEHEKDSVSPTEVSIASALEGERRGRRRKAVAAGAVVALLAGAALGFMLQLDPADADVGNEPPLVQGMSPPVSQAALPSETVPASGAAATVTPRADEVPLAEVPPFPSADSPRPLPVASSAVSAPKKSPRESALGTKANRGCDVPYTIDQKGRKRFKVECF